MSGYPEPEGPDISHSLAIAGWMSPDELQWLATQAQSHSCIAELGSHLGRSTRALAENTPGVVWAIDDWRGHSAFIGDIPPVVLFGLFCSNVIDLLNAGKVKVYKQDHGLIGTDLMINRFDMAFIDGDHEYTSVNRDISRWQNWLPPNSLLCGHDYDWPGVRQAVDDLLPNRQLVPDTSLWWVTT